MATKESVIKRAARRLKIIGQGQTVRAEQNDDLDDAYAEVHARLDAKSLATWSLSGDIPEEFVNPVVALMCKSRLDDYGVDVERRNEIRLDASTAEFDIADLLSNTPIGETEIEYF